MARSEAERLKDIREAIMRIERTIAGLDRAAFLRADEKTISTVAWSLVVIGEAVKALPAPLQDRHPGVDWRAFSGLRDFLTHQYFRIDPKRLWRAASRGLPPLQAAVEAELGP